MNLGEELLTAEQRTASAKGGWSFSRAAYTVMLECETKCGAHIGVVRLDGKAMVVGEVGPRLEAIAREDGWFHWLGDGWYCKECKKKPGKQVEIPTLEIAAETAEAIATRLGSFAQAIELLQGLGKVKLRGKGEPPYA